MQSNRSALRSTNTPKPVRDAGPVQGVPRARFERDGDGWWASRRFGEDNILGRGSTQEEALVNLEYQVAGFLDFLKEHWEKWPGVAERTPDRPSRPISRA